MNGMRDVIEALAARTAAQAGPAQEGDYIDEDGLLRCGRCNTRKQYRLVLPGIYAEGERVVSCICQCRSEERDAERQAEQKTEQVEKYQRRGHINPAPRFDQAEESSPLAKCRSYAEHWEEVSRGNHGLYLWGNRGTGKTFAAHCIANALIRRDPPVSVYVCSLSRVLNESYDKSETMERVKRSGLTILDDLGAERQTSYALEVIFSLVDTRYQTGKPLIVTTNMTAGDLQRRHGNEWDRILDRIKERCVPVAFQGPSRREAAAAENLRELNRILRGDE